MHALKTCQVIKSPEKVFMKYFRTKPCYFVLNWFCVGFVSSFHLEVVTVNPIKFCPIERRSGLALGT